MLIFSNITLNINHLIEKKYRRAWTSRITASFHLEGFKGSRFIDSMMRGYPIGGYLILRVRRMKRKRHSLVIYIVITFRTKSLLTENSGLLHYMPS